MTNSPPSNVNVRECETRVLASGIDSLVVAIDVEWKSSEFFERLVLLKSVAKENRHDAPSVLTLGEHSAPWVFNVAPQGSDGFEWLLRSRELVLKLGSSLKPTARPSVMAEIRSETLWTHGPDAAVARVLSLLTDAGAHVLLVKPSRIDLCVDVLVHESLWQEDLREHFITRAHDVAAYMQQGRFSGFTIGKGAVSARFYDKPREIALKSHKVWMYDIWGIDGVDDVNRIVRVEFQVRREALKQLTVNTWDQVPTLLPNLWAYCTKKWLRVVEDANLHHTQQTVQPWWQVVTDGFTGAQGATPLVRCKAIKHDLKQQAAQIVGNATSMLALMRQGEPISAGEHLDMESHLHLVLHEALKVMNVDDFDLTQRVRSKQAKQLRNAAGFKNAPGADPWIGVDSPSRE